MKRIRNIALLSALIAMSGMAAAQDLQQRHARPAPKELTKEMAMHRAAVQFDRADLNADGKLDRQERMAAREKARKFKTERTQRVREKRLES